MVTLLNPPPVHRFLTTDIHLVLKALVSAPFEPLPFVSVRSVTFKTIFLLTVTFARRISELGSFSVNPNLCVFDDKVVLRLDHLCQKLILYFIDPRN